MLTLTALLWAGILWMAYKAWKAGHGKAFLIGLGIAIAYCGLLSLALTGRLP